MKKLMCWCGAAIAALFLCPNVRAAAAGQLMVDTILPVPPAAAYSSTFSIRADGIDWASASILVSSLTQASPTFTGGSASTATFTVNDWTSLSTGTPHSTLTISSDTALVGSCISGGGPENGSFNVCNPAQFAITGTTATDCAAIASAIQSNFTLLVATCPSTPGNVITATATYGRSSWNVFTWNASSPTAISTGAWTGGHANAKLTVNGVTLTANKDFFPITSNAITASAIATAWNASVGSQTVTMQAQGAVIGATTTVVGTGTNYATFTSTQGALTLSPFISSQTIDVAGNASAIGFMAGGTNAAYALNGNTISLPGNTLGLAEGVWASGTLPNPLSAGTTYYAIPGSGGNMQLALTSTGAVAGLPIVFTSSTTVNPAQTGTLNVPAIAGTPGVAIVASNDNTHWSWYNVTPFNVSVGSTTYSSYTAGGQYNQYDLGHFDYSYIGVSVTAPTAGAIQVQAHVVGNAP